MSDNVIKFKRRDDGSGVSYWWCQGCGNKVPNPPTSGPGLTACLKCRTSAWQSWPWYPRPFPSPVSPSPEEPNA